MEPGTPNIFERLFEWFQTYTWWWAENAFIPILVYFKDEVIQPVFDWGMDQAETSVDWTWVPNMSPVVPYVCSVNSWLPLDVAGAAFFAYVAAFGAVKGTTLAVSMLPFVGKK